MRKRLVVGVTTSVLGIIGAGVWKGLRKLDAQQTFQDVYTAHFAQQDVLEYAVMDEDIIEGEALQQLLRATSRMTLEERTRAVNAKYELALHSVKGTIVYVSIGSPHELAVNGVTYKVVNGDMFYDAVMKLAKKGSA